MVRLTFDQRWMDEYWSYVKPEIVQCLTEYENNEDWTIKRADYDYCEINSLAESLPIIANFPLNGNYAETADRLLVLYAKLPLKTALAAYSWLDVLGKGDVTWSYVLSVYSRFVVAEGYNHTVEVVTSSKILLKRIQLFTSLVKFDEVFLTDSSAKLLFIQVQKALIGDSSEKN